MNIESAKGRLIYQMSELHDITNNHYYENDMELADRIKYDLEDAEYQIQQCKKALEEYIQTLKKKTKKENNNEE